MRQPVIGITMDRQRGTGRYHLNVDYAQSVIRAGGLPVGLLHEAGLAGRYVHLCDGFILSGGDDPDTAPFGEAVHAKAVLVDEGRQAFELALLAVLDRVDKPLLGICLGMQMMALHHGGRLYQHLSDVLGEAAAATHTDAEHAIHQRVACDWLIDGAVVTSHHHQAVAEAGAMRVCGVATDGVIEAIDLPGRRWTVGVQWHPERTAGPMGEGLMRRLVEVCGPGDR